MTNKLQEFVSLIPLCFFCKRTCFYSSFSPTPLCYKWQVFIEDLQRSGGDMAAAAQPLIALLEPLAADQIQAEVAMLSRDILLVVQSVSTEKARRQVGNPHVQPTGFIACWLKWWC